MSKIMKKLFYSLFLMAIAAMTFTSCENVPEPYDRPNGGTETPTPSVTIEPAGKGTEADPYNVAAAMQLLKAAKADEPTAKMYVRGKIVEIKGVETAQYGNASFYIADSKDSKVKLNIFQTKFLNDTKFTSQDQIKVGDDVVIYGPFVNFKGTTPETVGKGSSYIYMLNGQTSSGETPAIDDNSAEKPYSVAKSLELISSGKAPTNEVYVKGIISKAPKFNAKHKSLTYFISDDGTTAKELQIFSGKSFNGGDFASDKDLQVGQTVVVLGVIKSYTNPKTNEVTSQMNLDNKLVSVNGKTELQPGAGTTPSTPATEDALKIDGTTVTLTNIKATAGTETKTLDLTKAGFTDNQKVGTATFDDGTTVTFDANGEKNGPMFATKSKGVRLYKNNTITFEGKKAIAKIVFTCDSYKDTKYVGNATATITFDGKKAVYTNLFKEATGGGVQLRVQTITITYVK